MDLCIYLSGIPAVFRSKVCAKDWINALYAAGYLVLKQPERAFLCTACPLLPRKEWIGGGAISCFCSVDR